MSITIPSRLSDAELMAEVARLAICERRATVALVAHLADLDARRLYLGAGFPSMFTYCTQLLRLSEGGAYNRIEAGRAARKFPRVLDLLGQGALTLTTVRLLAPHLTGENHEDLLAAASHKSRRQVEDLLARLSPKPEVVSSVRKLPAAGPTGRAVEAANSLAAAAHGAEASTDRLGGAVRRIPADAARAVAPEAPAAEPLSPPAPRPPLVTALAPDRYQIRFTASAQTCEKLRLAQDLLRHAVPDGDPAEIFDRALTALLEDLARRKFAATRRPRASRGQPPASRNIPAQVKRAVKARDRGRCVFLAGNGRKCGERGFLEFHHIVPYARGGAATVANIQLRCRAHNGYEAELCFGARKPAGEGAVKERGASYGTASPGANSSRDELAKAPYRRVIPSDRPPDPLAGRSFGGHTQVGPPPNG